jgi:uncharacterized damage-inducible protein DinB
VTERGYPDSLVLPSHAGSSSPDVLAQAVAYAARVELQECLRILHHCIGQLTDEQVWNRPGPEQNAIGNLLLHLAGNLRQWAVVGLTDGEDHRQRPAEFAERNAIPTEALMQRLDACVIDAVAVLNSLTTTEALLQPRRIQGFNMTGVAALQHTVSHFRGHTQEIVGRTRQLLGDRYQFAWKPQSVEQGAVT